MSESPNDNRSLADLNIMVVDDDEDILALIEATLKDMGIKQIVKATDGAAALQLYDRKEKPFDFIICDWMMPNKSGLDVLQGIKKQDPDAHFIMLTSKTEQQNVIEAIDSGSDMYIKKPITPEELQDKIRFFHLHAKNKP